MSNVEMGAKDWVVVPFVCINLFPSFAEICSWRIGPTACPVRASAMVTTSLAAGTILCNCDLYNIVPSWLMAPDCPLADANNFTQTNGNSPVPKAQLLPLCTGKLRRERCHRHSIRRFTWGRHTSNVGTGNNFLKDLLKQTCSRSQPQIDYPLAGTKLRAPTALASVFPRWQIAERSKK